MFGLNNFDSQQEVESEKKAESQKSSSASDGRPKKRPCLIWKTTPLLQVLAFSKFGHVNIFDPNYLYYNTYSSKYVTNKIIPVSPKPSFEKRRAIEVRAKNGTSDIKTINTYLILILYVPEGEIDWKYANEYLITEDLSYINNTLFEIALEERMETEKSFATIIYPPVPDDQTTKELSDNSSSSGSSLPMTRAMIVNDVSGHISDTQDYVREWLTKYSQSNGKYIYKILF